MNEYSFEIKKKYGGEHPSYSGILTCNGSEYSMMLSADEEKEFSATIRDTAEMQKAYSQQDSLYVHIYRKRRKTPCFSHGDIRRSETKFLLKGYNKNGISKGRKI